MDFFRQEVSKRRPQANKPEAYESLMVQIVEMWGAFMGDDCENQGLKNLWMDAGWEGGIVDPKTFSLMRQDWLTFGIDNLFMAFTFRDIVALLSLSLSDNIVLRLGCEVNRIKKSGVCAVTVEAVDNFRGIFDDVVVTAPLGWLKRNENIFSPRLAPKISTAICSLGYWNLDKVFIKLPEAFWNNQASRSNQDHEDAMGNLTSPGFQSNLCSFVRTMRLTQIQPNGGRKSSHFRVCQNHSPNPSSCFLYTDNGEGILLGLSEA